MEPPQQMLPLGPATRSRRNSQLGPAPSAAPLAAAPSMDAQSAAIIQALVARVTALEADKVSGAAAAATATATLAPVPVFDPYVRTKHPDGTELATVSRRHSNL